MNWKSILPLMCSLSLIMAPMIGCQPAAEQEQTATAVTVAEESAVEQTTPAAGDGAAEASTWDSVQTTTLDGLTIVASGISAGTDVAIDCSTAAWVWSADQSADGWQWIRRNAGDATEWASDRLHETWAITESAAGEFSLWVQVQAADGIGWVRTEVPAAWQVVKDEAGNAWIWVGEHKVEVGVFAAVVTVVVAGLIVAPEAVGPAVVKGASVGAAKETAVFVADLWEHRRKDQNVAQRLNDVSRSTFMSIGQAVLLQCGSEVLAAQ